MQPLLPSAAPANKHGRCGFPSQTLGHPGIHADSMSKAHRGKSLQRSPISVAEPKPEKAGDWGSSWSMGAGDEGEPWALGTRRCKVLRDSLVSQKGGWFIPVVALTSRGTGKGEGLGALYGECSWGRVSLRHPPLNVLQLMPGDRRDRREATR